MRSSFWLSDFFTCPLLVSMMRLMRSDALTSKDSSDLPQYGNVSYYPCLTLLLPSQKVVSFATRESELTFPFPPCATRALVL